MLTMRSHSTPMSMSGVTYRYWHSRTCIIHCIRVSKQQFVEITLYSSTKSSVGSGAFMFIQLSNSITSSIYILNFMRRISELWIGFVICITVPLHLEQRHGFSLLPSYHLLEYGFQLACNLLLDIYPHETWLKCKCVFFSIATETSYVHGVHELECLFFSSWNGWSLCLI